MATRYDPATPYENALELERILPGSRLLTIEGHGHSSSLVPSACAAAATERYLVAGELPEAGTMCSPDFTPFDPPAEPPPEPREAFGLRPTVR